MGWDRRGTRYTIWDIAMCYMRYVRLTKQGTLDDMRWDEQLKRSKNRLNGWVKFTTRWNDVDIKIKTPICNAVIYTRNIHNGDGQDTQRKRRQQQLDRQTDSNRYEKTNVSIEEAVNRLTRANDAKPRQWIARHDTSESDDAKQTDDNYANEAKPLVAESNDSCRQSTILVTT